MSEESENRGVIFSLPCTCGTCGTVLRWILLRWCACCGDAICPSCFPDDVHDGGLDRCRKCIEIKLPTRLELAGYREAARRWQPIMAEQRYDLLPRNLQQEMALCPITEACLRQFLWGDCSLELALTVATVELGKANRELIAKLTDLATKGPPPQMIVCSQKQFEAFKEALDRATPKADAELPRPIIAPASHPAAAPPSS